MNTVYGLINLNKNFKIITDNEILIYEDIIRLIKRTSERLFDIHNNWNSKLVYFDVNNKFTFFILFFSLLKLKAKPILIPTEAKTEDYLDGDYIYISDNKLQKNSIFVDDKLLLKNNYIDLKQFKKEDNTDYDFFLYTSGSTGKSKLVGKDFNSVTIELRYLQGEFGISVKDIFLFTPPLYHIYGLLFGLFLPLYSGSSTIFENFFLPDKIYKAIKDYNATVFVSTPQYYKMFSDLNLFEYFKMCRKLFSSSAPLSQDVSEYFYKNGISIIEIYGSTESGGIARRIAAENPFWEPAAYVTLIRNSEEESNLELIINSSTISVDYDKEKGYNTGDLVEFDSNNKFRLIGRNNRFLKISGKRVDSYFIKKKFLDYVSSKYSLDKMCDESCYVDQFDNKLTLIYEFDLPVTKHELKRDLLDILPAFMVPKIIIKDEIPKNKMGKISRKGIEKLILKP